MFTTFLAAAALVVPAIAFNMATPVLTQCGQSQLTWDDTGSGPYSVWALDPNDPCGNALAELGNHNGSSMTWYNITLPAGQSVEFLVEDTQSNEAWSATTVVGAGSDSSCLSASQLSAVSSAAAAPAASPSTAAAAQPTSAAPVSAAHPTTKAAANAASAPSSSSKPAAVAGAISGASAASFSIPALALSAVVGVFALL
jgi:hypothetical protein